MSRLGAVLAVGVLAWPVLGDPPPEAPPKPAPTGDLAMLQGNWKPLSITFEGESMGKQKPEVLRQLTAVFDHAEYHLYFVDRATPTPRVLKLAIANLTLDPTTTPKSVTFEFATGEYKGQKRHGIYEVSGNELKMCYGKVNQPKPTKFDAPAKSGLYLEVWARQTK